MRLALNGATIMRSPLEHDVRIAADCGYAALEIWAGKIPVYERNHTLGQLAESMRARGVAPWCINSIENITHRAAAARADLVDELRGAVVIARAIGAPAIVVVPGTRPTGVDARASAGDAVDVLRAMSDVAGEIKLAFEFLGKPQCAVPTLDMAIEIIERVDRPNVGMVIDTFHFYAGGSSLDDLRRVPIARVIVLHLNGCADLPRDELTDAHRLYPGEGVIPIDAILSSLHARGFDGVASIEIFRPEYWEQHPADVARTAYDAASAVLH